MPGREDGMDEINFNQLKGKIEKDDDWRDGVNAHRRWITAEIEQIKEDIHDIKVFLKQYKMSIELINTWKKYQDKEESKIQGESL